MIEPIPNTKHKVPSDRAFGLLMFVVGIIGSAWGFWESRLDLSMNMAFGAGVILLITLLFPKALHPLNRVWHQFGLLLGRIISPIVLAVLFYGVITPISVITRLFGRDPLRLKAKANVKTFWIARQTGESLSDSFKNQF